MQATIDSLHGWGKPSHYYTTPAAPPSCIVVAGLAPAMWELCLALVR